MLLSEKTAKVTVGKCCIALEALCTVAFLEHVEHVSLLSQLTVLKKFSASIVYSKHNRCM